MKFTLKAVLWAKDIDKNGECPIAISIAGGGKRTYYNTKIKCPESHWDGSRIKKGVEHYDIKNATIDDLISTVNKEILNRSLQQEKLTIHDVKMLFNPSNKKAGNFLSFYLSYIDQIKATNKKAAGTIAVWETEYKQLAQYAGEFLSFKDVTTDFLNNYHRNIAGYARNTITKKLKKLMQIVNSAIRHGHMKREQVAGFEMTTYENTSRKYLTLEQTERVANAIYKGEFDYDNTMKTVACYFLIACYSALRYSDWKRFVVEKLHSGEALKVQAQKNKEPIYIPLKTFKRLATIIKYVQKHKIHFTCTERVANDKLKSIGAYCRIPMPITTRLARHTAATLLGEMRYSAFEIAQILGVSERTATIYRKETRSGMSDAFDRLGGL